MNGKGYEVFAPKVGEMLLLRGGATDGCHFNIPAGIPSALEKHLCKDKRVSSDKHVHRGEERRRRGWRWRRCVTHGLAATVESQRHDQH